MKLEEKEQSYIMKDGKTELSGRKAMKNKVNILSFFENLITENYSNVEQYMDSIKLDKSELAKFKAKKNKKVNLNQEEEESNLESNPERDGKRKPERNDSNKEDKMSDLAKNLPSGDEKPAGDEDEVKSRSTVPPDFSEEEKKDYSKVIMSEANVFREIVSLFNRIRAGYSLEEEEASDNFKKYFTRLTLAEREALYLFLKAFVIVLDPEIRDVYSDEEEEEEETKKSSNIARLPLPSEFGVKIESEKRISKKKDDPSKEAKSDSETSSNDVSQRAQREKQVEPEGSESKTSIVQKPRPVSKAPAPIVVGEGRQDKNDILRLLKEIG